MNEENNLAFIDGQNLYLGTKQDNWSIDLSKLRIYLKDKYKVVEAYYFLGYLMKKMMNYIKKYKKPDLLLSLKNIVSMPLQRKKGM